MRNIILFDSESRERLLPLTFTRPIGELRIGILTIREKWERHLGGKVSYITQDYLSGKFPIQIEEDNLVIDAAVLPNEEFCQLIRQLGTNEALLHNGDFIAARIPKNQFYLLMNNEEFENLSGYELEGIHLSKIQYLWDIFQLNKQALVDDFQLLTKGRQTERISDTNRVTGRENIFVEPGAIVEFSTLNAIDAPIYIGKNATIMEGCLVRGGLAMGNNSILKMGTKIYGPTTLGPYCKVGGELKNSVLFGYSNKSHDGYLGNSVLGEWCNLGANTSNSNMKNNYSNVRVWDYTENDFQNSGEQFCGLFMGDHSKCGINTMFNTGTVVGVFANIFGAGFPKKFIPSFSWGAVESEGTYRLEKACEVGDKVWKRRKKNLDNIEKEILSAIFEQTAIYRSWENNRSKTPREARKKTISRQPDPIKSN